MIVLYEIYGQNTFIKETCNQYVAMGYDVYCPNLYGTEPFTYSQMEEAYEHFINKIGFDCFHQINLLIKVLKLKYEKVFVIGFSVGATIAWRCSETILCDGVICYYGSRIRDYLTTIPKCPVLLIFAEQDSFPVADVALKLRKKEKVMIEILSAKHGFCDYYSNHYNQIAKEKSETLTKDFMQNLRTERD